MGTPPLIFATDSLTSGLAWFTGAVFILMLLALVALITVALWVMLD